METSERRDGWVLSRLSPIFLMSACTGQVHFGKTMRKAAVGDKKKYYLDCYPYRIGFLATPRLLKSHVLGTGPSGYTRTRHWIRLQW
jgi:hypothetical protein